MLFHYMHLFILFYLLLFIYLKINLFIIDLYKYTLQTFLLMVILVCEI